MRRRAPAASVSFLILLCFVARCAYPQTRATVVSTNPVNGATGVSPYLASFSITFSKPMDTSRCGASTRSWPYGEGGSCTWSADKLTMTLARYNPGTPFAPGLKIEAYLVDPEWNPQESYLLDAQGNHIDPYYYSFTITGWPKVVSTNPADGATGVSPYLESISITFNKAMDTSRCGASDTNWPYQDGGSCSWSADARTMTLTRSVPIGASKILVYLNLPGTTPVLRDADGLDLGAYSFSFTFRGSSGLTIKVPADPGKGFQWSYYLYVPVVVRAPTVLIVEPNNSGYPTVDSSVDDMRASDLINSHKDWGYDLGSPYLVPTFPRPAASLAVNTQSLDRDSLTTTLPGLERVDLQLIAMIDHARAKLAAQGITVGPKVWMIGFSASGAFTNRFALLHPDRIQAASAGSGNEYATAPVSTWKGKALPYPVGIADLQQLTGKPFDTAAFSKAPVQIYIGDQQIDDAFFDSSDVGTVADAALIAEVFGGPTFRRYPASEAAYNSIGSKCEFVIFPGMGHEWPSWNFIKEFLERNRTDPTPAPLPKPFLYTLYFPHVASFGQWETEIALTTTAEVPVQAELLAMAADGGNPIESIPVTIPAVGRVEFTAGRTFKNPQDVAYIAVHSDSGFLAGYTRFSQPGNRVSLPLVGSTAEGYFTKVERDGWTGIAFVNVDGGTADVSLAAYDDNGVQIASRSLSLAPGCKYVGMVNQLFSDADVSRLRHFRFSSDKKLVGFTVSASSDGLMLDGLQSLGGYVRQR